MAETGVGGSLAQFRIACAYFASRGMVCATANYRMLTKAESKKLPPSESRKRVCVTDAKSAVRWFKQQSMPASMLVEDVKQPYRTGPISSLD